MGIEEIVMMKADAILEEMKKDEFDAIETNVSARLRIMNNTQR